MDLFTGKELVIMATVLGGVLLIIVFLTILDFIDEKKGKRKDKKVETVNEEIKEDKKVIVEDIEVLDFNDNIIEMKEEVNNNVSEVILDELDEVMFEDVKEVKINEIIQITNEQERAKEELNRIEVELEKEEDYSNTITNFEIEQEENAIISYDELIQNMDKLYDQNEVIQYDDGNEPITIDEVIKKFSSNEMVFENTVNLDKLNKEVDSETNLVKAYENK